MDLVVRISFRSQPMMNDLRLIRLILVPAATWPIYSLDNPQNFVFDANVTSYLEPDIYRAEGIAYMIENMYIVFGR